MAAARGTNARLRRLLRRQLGRAQVDVLRPQLLGTAPSKLPGVFWLEGVDLTEVDESIISIYEVFINAAVRFIS